MTGFLMLHHADAGTYVWFRRSAIIRFGHYEGATIHRNAYVITSDGTRTVVRETVEQIEDAMRKAMA